MEMRGGGAVSFAAMHESEAGAAVTPGDDLFSPVSCQVATQLASLVFELQ